MTRYILNRSKAESRPWSVHPIWRGIGCLWLVLLPVMSYAGAYLLVRKVIFGAQFQAFVRGLYANNGVNLIPSSLYQKLILPSFNLGPFHPNLNNWIRWLPGQPLYYLDFVFWFLFILLAKPLLGIGK